MALTFKTGIPGGWIALWHITEGEEELRRMVTPHDLASCAGMAGARRRERLAWRAIVRTLLPQAGRIGYNAAGAPVLEGTGGYIGVSHCEGYAAVIWCDTPCGIDIEPAARDFRRASARYVSPAEARVDAAADPRFLAAAWCAKEVLYKLSGRRGLNLLKDIRILSADMAAGRLTGTVCGSRPMPLGMLEYAGIVVVYARRAPRPE